MVTKAIRRRVYPGWLKRALDLSLTLPLFLLLLPVMLVVALLIRWRLGAPVLFRQERPGLNGQPFFMMKFRTMKEERGTNGVLLPDAQRLTHLGRWLRRLSLDELPTLFHVLRGEMSLVGPRPLLMEYLPLYSEEQARRHEVLPGITGWAQIHGRNALRWEEKFQLDVWYVEHCSLGLDLRILFRTVWTVLRPSGIEATGHATMPRFRGTKKPSSSSGEPLP